MTPGYLIIASRHTASISLNAKYIHTYYLGNDPDYTVNHLFEGITCDPGAGYIEPIPKDYFGFWLPRGIRVDSAENHVEDLYAGLKRFNAIEERFRDWFNASPSEILLEREQAEWYNTNPRKANR